MSVRQRRPSTTTETIISKATSIEQSIEKKAEKALTVLWDALPTWQQDNHYIISGYRSASNSFLASFHSLSYLHNESVNIYSHLLGAIFFTVAGVLLYQGFVPRYPKASNDDVAAFACFFAGAAACLGMSATYHTISNHSPHVAKWGNKLDYVGIVSLITGSFVPAVFYGFYCEPSFRRVYWTMIASLGVGCASVSVFEKFRTPAWRPYRAAMFVAMGLSAVFPVIHGMKLYGFHQMRDRMGLSWILLEGFLYILGAGLYAARWPERSAPGKYDIWGSSHQIFHCLVLLAAASHLYGLLRAFDYHHGGTGVRC